MRLKNTIPSGKDKGWPLFLSSYKHQLKMYRLNVRTETTKLQKQIITNIYGTWNE